MTKGNTGTSMCGKIEYTNNVNKIKCNCECCKHSKISAGILFCVYYDIVNPHRHKCARYSSGVRRRVKRQKIKSNQNKKQQNNSAKNKNFSLASKIEKYFIEELNMSQSDAFARTTRINTYKDIAKEFAIWIDKRDFPKNGVSINGYNAKKIHEIAPSMNGAGVYNILIVMRENPENAMNTLRRYIKD